jgi:hypothetical protein
MPSTLAIPHPGSESDAYGHTCQVSRPIVYSPDLPLNASAYNIKKHAYPVNNDKYRKNQKPRRVRDLKGHLHVVKFAGEWVAVRVTETPVNQRSVDKWGVDPRAFHVVGRYATRKKALRRAQENLFEQFEGDECEKFKERYYISGAAY